MNIRLTTVPFGSNEYDALVRLRISALLEPIGIPASYIDGEKEKQDVFVGAYKGNEIIGCCVLTRRSDALVQLRQMAVLPSMRGQHIGAAILNFAEETARRHGYRTLMMHARNPVIGFYESCGYTIEGAEFFEVGMGHHRMAKSL